MCSFAGKSVAVPELSEDQARELGYVAISPNTAQTVLEVFVIAEEPKFILFQIIDPNANHNAYMGTLAIHRRTADVWNIAGKCTLLNAHVACQSCAAYLSFL
jgi:hypothetical protein